MSRGPAPIAVIARKELREMSRSGQLRWGMALVFVLLAISLLAGLRAAERAETERALAAETSRRLFDRQPDKNAHTAAHYGIHVFKPRGRLSFFDEGILPYTGLSVHLGAHHQKRLTGSAAEDATTVQRFGTLTPAGILGLLLPLLIVLLVHSMVAGERDRGTLPLTLSVGLRPAILVTGKAVGALLILGVLMLPVLVIGGGLLVVLGGLDLVLDVRLGLMLVLYVTYFAAWVALALAVSLRARSGRNALVTLFGFWIFSGIVLPRLAGDIGKHLYRPPSAQHLQQQIIRESYAGLPGDPSAEERHAALERQVLAEFGVGRLEDLPVNFNGILLQATEDYSNRVIDRRFGELWRAFERQETVLRIASIASPFLALRSLSQGVAGTDLMHHRHFADAAEAYRRFLVRTLHEDLIRNGPPGVGGRYLTPPDVWRTVPPFSYEPPSLARAFRAHVADLVIVLSWGVAALGSGWLAARRMSPVI